MVDRWSDAEAYEVYVGRWSRMTGAAFLGWLDAGPGRRWLDLGCGTGALTARILRLGAPSSVVGIEPSADFLALAQSDNADARASFAQGSGESIPVGDASVDLAVSGLVLNFLPDLDRAMGELGRVVVPGGTVAAYVWDYAGHAQFIRYFWDAAVALDPAAADRHEGARFPLCRPEALRAAFTAAGLRDVVVAPLDIVTPFADFDDYWQPFLSGVGPAPGYCVSLDEAGRQRLRDRLARALPADPDGRILLAARAWTVKGTRV